MSETGVPHLQGYLQLNGQQTIRAFQKKLQEVNVQAHLEVARGSLKQNHTYCTKADGVKHEWGVSKAPGTRTDLAKIKDLINAKTPLADIREQFPGPFYRYHKAFTAHAKMVNVDEMDEAIKAEMAGVVLRDWQLDAVQRLTTQDERKVLWVVDTVGNTGKSFLAKYLFAMNNAFAVTSGKTSDIAYAYNMEEIVVFDFSRQKQDFVNYSVIEDFKNGAIFSPKYESTTLRFKPAKVIVFSNWMPDMSLLSEDRWDIMDLDPSLEFFNPMAGYGDFEMDIDEE